LMIAGAAWRKTDAAIADDRGGHAVLRGGRDVLAPGHLTVIVGVDVDETRCNQPALGFDFVAALGQDLADLGDAAVADRDIGLEQVAAAAIGDRTAADHEVWAV